MKKINLIVIISVAALTFFSCKKDASFQSTGQSQSPDETAKTEIVNEGYSPSYIGKSISAIYDGRQVDLLEIEDGKYLYDNDVVLERKNFTLSGDANASRVYAGRKWVGRIVRWKYASGVSKSLKQKWATATQAWNRDLKFKFTQITSSTGDYILVQQNNKGQAFSTSIGRAGGEQIISMDPKKFATGSMIHEIGHAMGLHHEQKRPDRNKYIVINYSNIRPNWHSQYNACSGCTTTGSFDFNSIMLYGSFASNKVAIDITKPVMTKKSNGSTWVPNRTKLSAGDISTIEKMY